MKRVFVVEDHPVMREMLAEFIEREPDLELCGEAESAMDAVEKYRDCHPDLILIDVSLPDLNGIELLGRIRNVDAELPMLIISGHDENAYAEQAYRAGARGYVVKNDPELIMQAIHRALRGELCFSRRVLLSTGQPS